MKYSIPKVQKSLISLVRSLSPADVAKSPEKGKRFFQEAQMHSFRHSPYNYYHGWSFFKKRT